MLSRLFILLAVVMSSLKTVEQKKFLTQGRTIKTHRLFFAQSDEFSSDCSLVDQYITIRN
jgi:hypothetical protein